MATTRDALHRLVDELPKRELSAARRYLEYLRNMGDPVLRAFLEAPEDDEELSEDEAEALREAYEDVRAGRLTSLEEVKRELGL